MKPLIIENLGKRYRINHQARHDTFRDSLAAVGRRLLRGGRAADGEAAREDFWALRDVSFSLGEGEIMGVIGRNGAGKSTLLKLLSRITEPTEGRIRIQGKIASLLEVGTGFHPELSGRENIFLNGSILGMKRAEVRRRFDEIVAFSGVERFLDTPVKRYSSGMYVRLAFAVAAHLEPDILIVDEVLAVGDMAFQKKCLGKIDAVARDEGRTVLFVTHNMVAVQSLCQRVLLLHNGRIAYDGGVAEGIGRYLRTEGDSASSVSWTQRSGAPKSSSMWVRAVRVGPSDRSESVEDITMQSEIRVETEFEVTDADRLQHLTYHLVNESGIVVLTSGSGARRFPLGRHHADLSIPGNLLNSGNYQLKLLLVEDGNRVAWERENIVTFTVVDRREREHGWHGKEPGVVQPQLNWNLRPQTS